MNNDSFNSAASEPDPRRSHPLLYRIDQAGAGVVIAVSLCLIGAYGWYNIGYRRGEIEVEPGEIEFQIDLNSADWPELMILPDLGETRARQIVQWRQQHGPFHVHDDLLNIRGIGPRTLEKIRPHLRPILQATEKAGT